MSSLNNTTAISPIVSYPSEIIFSGISCLIIGLFGVVSNTLTLTVISKNQKLHTPCFTLLGAHAICGWLTATGFVNDGVQRLGIFFNVWDAQYRRLTCYLMFIPKTISIPPSAIFTCMIGLDRLYGICMPTEYRKHGRKFICTALTIGGLVAVLNVLIAGLTAPSPITGLIMCYNYFSAFNPLFTRYFTNHNLALCILSVCTYASIVCVVRFRQFRSNAENDQRSRVPRQILSATAKTDRFVQTQLAILPLIQTIMIAYLLFGVCPEIMAVVISVVDDGRYQPKVMLYAAILKCLSVCTDFLTLTTKSREFKTTLKKVIGFKNATVFVHVRMNTNLGMHATPIRVEDEI